jgi:hypothetical protein
MEVVQQNLLMVLMTMSADRQTQQCVLLLVLSQHPLWGLAIAALLLQMISNHLSSPMLLVDAAALHHHRHTPVLSHGLVMTEADIPHPACSPPLQWDQ